jgi:hypothetical protein
MRTLRIEAASLGSAHGFQKALTGFACELEEDDTGYFSVKIPIQTDRDIVAILRVLERHVVQRLQCVPQLGLEGRTYVLGD